MPIATRSPGPREPAAAEVPVCEWSRNLCVCRGNRVGKRALRHPARGHTRVEVLLGGSAKSKSTCLVQQTWAEPSPAPGFRGSGALAAAITSAFRWL